MELKSMQVRFYGFRIKQGVVSLSEFFKSLKLIEGQEIDYRGEARLLYVSEKKDCFVGVLLTARDQRRFCELKTGKNEFKVKVTELKGNSRLVDFNFFAIRKKSGTGLLQHYRGSCGLTSFGFLFRMLYRDECSRRKKAEIAEAEEKPGKTLAIRAIRTKYKDQLELTPMFKPDDFYQLVSNMAGIQSFGFACETFSKKEPWLTPVKAGVSRERATFSFSKGLSVGSIKSAIRAALKIPEYSEFDVSGLDATGLPVSYNVADNLECFGRCEFDEIADDGSLDVSKVDSSPIVAQLITAMDAHKQYFV